MHPSSKKAMKKFTEDYLADQKNLQVLEAGASTCGGGSYRPLFQDHKYIGADIQAGANVGIVLPKPYYWGIVEQYDVVVSGQTMEHVEDLKSFVAAVEMALKPGGITCLIAPWKWQYHEYPMDCWRILPQGMRWLFEQTGLIEEEIYMVANDTVGIARKPA